MMKKLLISVLLACVGAAHAEVYVIASANSNFAVNQQQLTSLYMGKVVDLGVGSVKPYNMEESLPVFDEFNEKALGRSSSQMKAYWSKLIFTGKANLPKKVKTDDEMIAVVQADNNVIGYVSTQPTSDKVRVLLKF